MQRFYQLDLADLYAGRMTPRRCAVLVANLPSGAMTWAALGSDAAWKPEALLLAGVFDAVQAGNWQRSGGEGKHPEPIPRPGDAARDAEKTKGMALRAARHQARRALRAEQLAQLAGGVGDGS